MIVALILIYTALIFALGVIVGQTARKGQAAIIRPTPKTEFNTEIRNFLNYDGSNQ